MKNIMTTILFLSAISFSSFSYAEWTYSYQEFTKRWVVTDGANSILYKKERSAKKAAKALNKNEKKIDKKENGFWNDGSEYCANPRNEC